jgi:hypothetical protein
LRKRNRPQIAQLAFSALCTSKIKTQQSSISFLMPSSMTSAAAQTMPLAAIESVEWMAKSFDTSTENIELALWVMLLAGLLFATVHFITMMVTKWGDSEPTGKAFMFSILVHLSLAFGAVAVSPPEPITVVEDIPERTELREVFVDNDEEIKLETTGNTRVWEKPAEEIDQQLARTDRTPLEFKPLEGPERRPEPLTEPDISLPDRTHTPELPAARPEVQNFGNVGPIIESAAPYKVQDTMAEARPDIEIPTLPAVRRRVDESGLTDIKIQRRPNRGAVDQVSPKFDRSREFAAIDLPQDPTAFLRRDVNEDAIQRRTGPAPSELPVDDAGTKSDAITDDSLAGALGPIKFKRNRARTPKMEEFGGVQRFKPDRTPSTPNPISDPVVGVRRSVASALPIPGLQPNIIQPNFAPINPNATANLPPTYRLRSLANREKAARINGGTSESERAVEASLRWLALHQSAAGYWDADGFSSMCPGGARCTGRSGLVGIDDEGVNRLNAGITSDTGVTGLSILAFLGAGYTHEEGQYADQVDRAIRWLIRTQRGDGFLGGNSTRYAQMYCHAIATYALAESLGMQTDRTMDDRLRKPLQKAVAYIVDSQSKKDGGWRYVTGQKSDMSMFGWQLMALKSAEIAGIKFPKSSQDLMIKFLKDRSMGKSKGLASYRILEAPYTLPPSASMTAEALFCKQIMGLARDNPQSVEAIDFLNQRVPTRQSEDIYYWYYGTLAMYQYGGADWRNWNDSLRDYLVQDQRTTDHAAGSWDPKSPWGQYGGRVFSTALSTLCLEVYYRFLPLYQLNRELDDE